MEKKSTIMDDVEMECELCWKMLAKEDTSQVHDIKCCDTCFKTVQLLPSIEKREERESMHLSTRMPFSIAPTSTRGSATKSRVICDVCSCDVINKSGCDVLDESVTSHEASGMCHDCHVWLCVKHKEQHSAKFTDHCVGRYGDYGDEYQGCSEHAGRMCTYVCMKCQIGVCAVCALCSHKDHHICSQTENDQELLKRLLPQAVLKLGNAKLFLDKIRQLEENTSSQYDASIQALQAALRCIKESSVFKMTSDTLEKTRGQKEERMEQLRGVVAAVGGYVVWVEACCARANRVIDHFTASPALTSLPGAPFLPNVTRGTLWKLTNSFQFLLEIEIEARFPAALTFESEIPESDVPSKIESVDETTILKENSENALQVEKVGGVREKRGRLDRWDSGIEWDIASADMSEIAYGARTPMALDTRLADKENIESPPKPPRLLTQLKETAPDNFVSINKQTEVRTKRRVLGDLANELNVKAVTTNTALSSPQDVGRDKSGIDFHSQRDTIVDTVFHRKSGRLPSISETEIDILLEQEKYMTADPKLEVQQCIFDTQPTPVRTSFKATSSKSDDENKSKGKYLLNDQTYRNPLMVSTDKCTQTYTRYEEIPVSVPNEQLVTYKVEQAGSTLSSLKSSPNKSNHTSASSPPDHKLFGKGLHKQETPKRSHYVYNNDKETQKTPPDSRSNLQSRKISCNARVSHGTAKQTTEKKAGKTKALTRSMSLPTATSVTNTRAPLNRCQSEAPTPTKPTTCPKSESNNLKKTASHGFGGFLLFSALGHLAKNSEKEKEKGERRSMYVDGYPSMYG